ncbi:Acyl-CoA synthetase (AMP-forming)/AMP-acid ligase II [Lachnospiraceae bacterium KH1T2]|nr:Acyl-CoA synthetase (AMP-forming)/AMP-acid ligase II [Lachnospiraceae bacterium KH1T2]
MDFSEVYRITIENFKGKKLLTWFRSGEEFTVDGKGYAGMVDAAASELEKKLSSIEKGKWIGLKSDNHYLWFAVFFGLLKIGYPVLLIDANASKEQVEAFRMQADMRAIITDKAEDHTGLVNVTMEELEKAEAGEIKEVSWESRIAFCTSGTTGRAKVYVFYADAIYAQCLNVSKCLLHDEGIVGTRNEGGVQANPMLLTLPLRHCLGFGVTLAFITAGYPIVMPQKPGIFGIIDTCRDRGIWFLCSVPAIWKGILSIANKRFGSSKPEAMKKLLGEKLTFGCSSGARLDAATAKKLIDTGIYIVNGWGMTETSFVTMGAIADDPSLDYVGVFYNNHSAVVIDPETGEEKSEGYGELAVNGKSMYSSTLNRGKEIFRNPKEYFRSGDMAEIHSGRLYFKGRHKGVIISDNGENIYPEELDSHFSFLEGMVSQFVTVGIDDRPTLFISSSESDDFEDTTIFEKIVEANLKLPLNKRLANVYVTDKVMPVTSKGETARFYIKEFYNTNADAVRKLPVKKERKAV